MKTIIGLKILLFYRRNKGKHFKTKLSQGIHPIVKKAQGKLPEK